MDLQVSVFLLFALFTAGHALSCYECKGLLGMVGSCAFQKEKTCPSGLSKCLSFSVQSIPSLTTKTKDCAADCASGTMSFGSGRMSFECCNTDGCNHRDAPDPSANAPNGMSCYTCDGRSCSNVVDCVGTEDRCIKGTWASGSHSEVFKGCSSNSICASPMSSTTGITDISCCKGNLCNAAPSVAQSFPFLCCALLSFILIS